MFQTVEKNPKESDLLVLAMHKAHAQVHGKPASKPAQKREIAQPRSTDRL